MLIRFFIYGLLGWGMEIIWTAFVAKAIRHEAGWRLLGVSYVWMFPLYGLAAILYEPLHNAIRTYPLPVRAIIYAAGFMAIEYAAGWLLRRITGSCPWDYSKNARWHLHGLMRWDYAPLWAMVGLGLEWLHDFLVRLTPAIEAALRGLNVGTTKPRTNLAVHPGFRCVVLLRSLLIIRI